MARITISYRRADSDAMSGRIRDKLADYYGQESIFMDIDSIPVGIDFREQIRNELAKNDALIVVVGPKWRGPGKGGKARINDENDPVRVEVETALQRGIPVVPVLVNGANIPKPDELPATLRNFAFHNGAIVDSGQDFHQHMERLIRSLDRVLGMRTQTNKLQEPLQPLRMAQVEVPPTPTPPAKNSGAALKWAAVVAGVCLAAGAGAGGTWFYHHMRSAPVTAAVPAETKPSTATISPPPSGAQLAVTNPNPATGSTSSTAVAPQPSAATAPVVQPSPSPPPSSYQAAAAPPARAPAQPSAAATPQTAAVQPTEKAVPAIPTGSACKGNASFEDNFKTPEVGWARMLGARDTGSNAFFAESQLVMKPAQKRSRTIVYPSLIFKAATICATIQSPAELKAHGETAAGLAFWASDDRNLYSLELIPDGSYNVHRLIDNNWSFITFKPKSDAIKQGAGAVNHLEVRTKDATATLFINGVKVQDFKGQPPQRINSVGFIVRNESDNDYEWKFHNISVYETN